MRVFFLILFLALAAGGAILFFTASPCSEPLAYRVGNTDPRFEISEGELLPLLEKAEAVWERPAGRDLFVYESTAPLPVNFIFDERQMRTLEGKKLDAELVTLEDSQAEVEKEYGAVSQLYEKSHKRYETQAAEYEQRVRDFNGKVERWNREGGASEEEYQDLKDEEEEIEKLGERLEKERRALNRYAEEIGTLADKDQALVESYNKEIATFEEKYGQAEVFDQGIFDGSAVTIYQFHEEADLILVLAHEFGHALGLDHVDDPQALMFPLLEEQNIETPGATVSDLEALREICEERKNPLRRLWDGFLSKETIFSILKPV